MLLTDAELDHTLGLLLLREGRGVDLHAAEAVRDTLPDGTALLRTLQAYCPVRWHPRVQELTDAVREQLDDCDCARRRHLLARRRADPARAGPQDRARDGTPADRRSRRQPRAAVGAADRTEDLHPRQQHQPILLDDSPERRTVAQHGMEVATDGLELEA